MKQNIDSILLQNYKKYKIGERIKGQKGQKGRDSDLQKTSSLPHLTRPGKSQEKRTQREIR
jgi:hypothetical protein